MNLFNRLTDGLVTVGRCQHALTIVRVAITATDWIEAVFHLNTHRTWHSSLTLSLVSYSNIQIVLTVKRRQLAFA